MSNRLSESLEQARLSDLIANIETGHHTFTRSALERIEKLFQEHSAASIRQYEELLRCFNALYEELLPHLMKEENILFPHIVAMERDPLHPPSSCFGTIANPIYMMRVEHATCQELLTQLRSLTGGYDATSSKPASELYTALEELDGDLVEHIHWEDEVLFPRALELEAASH